jgi:hypothetical protein
MVPQSFYPKNVLTKLLSLGVDILKFKNKEHYEQYTGRRNLEKFESLLPIRSVNNKYSNNITRHNNRRILSASENSRTLSYTSTPPRLSTFQQNFSTPNNPITPPVRRTLFNNE